MALKKSFLKIYFKLIQKNQKNLWYTITNIDINDIILQIFGDSAKRKIIESTSNIHKSITIILKDCDPPQTTGYRKIKQLIRDGLLVQSGFVIKDNKKTNMHVYIFNNLKINIENNNIIVDIHLTKLEPENSSISPIA